MQNRGFDYRNLISSGNFGTQAPEQRQEQMHDFSGDEEETDFRWVHYFLSKQGNEYFCRIDESYINDSFNLYGMVSMVPYYDAALDLITDTDEREEYSEEHQELIEHDADVLYGLIHARYIVTNRGLQAMFEKYKLRQYGECPYVYCKKKALLPCGLSNEKNKDSVKLYCPSCEMIYRPRSSRHENIDGAFFGTTFAHLFFMTFPQLKPTHRPQSVIPKVYGFRIHPDAYVHSLEESKKKQRSMQRRIKRRQGRY